MVLPHIVRMHKIEIDGYFKKMFHWGYILNSEVFIYASMSWSIATNLKHLFQLKINHFHSLLVGAPFITRMSNT